MKIKYSAISDGGKIRKENQDRIYISRLNIDGSPHQEACGCLCVDTVVLAVFDGMGGEMCGGKAAEIAAETVREQEKTDLAQLCKVMNENICRYMEQNQIRSMGSTAAMVRLRNHTANCCNLGDSSIFLVNAAGIYRLSEEHTLTLGTTKPRRVLTQYLGIPETEMVIEPSTRIVSLKEGDRLLLCSDGLTDMVETEEIYSVINGFRIEDAAKELFTLAMEKGGLDNISIIVCEETE